ncbi:MAG: hypothetical protein AAF903_15805 [Pseudomonadota bacterium]
MTFLKNNRGKLSKWALVALLGAAVSVPDFDGAQAAPFKMTGALEASIVQEVQQRRIRRNNRRSRRNRNAAIGLGVAGAVIGAIAADRARRSRSRRYARDCWYETEERWSPRRGRYVLREVRVCD